MLNSGKNKSRRWALLALSIVAIMSGCQSDRQECSEDGKVWMEVDTTNCALLGFLDTDGGVLVDTLMHYDLALMPSMVLRYICLSIRKGICCIMMRR